MIDNHREVETIAEVSELDWEVPGAYYEVPALDNDATDEEISANKELRDEQIYSALCAFECWNEVSLQGDAYDYFRASAQDFYQES